MIQATRIAFLADSSGHGIVIEIRLAETDQILAHLPIPLADVDELIERIRLAARGTRLSVIVKPRLRGTG